MLFALGFYLPSAASSVLCPFISFSRWPARLLQFFFINSFPELIELSINTHKSLLAGLSGPRCIHAIDKRRPSIWKTAGWLCKCKMFEWGSSVARSRLSELLRAGASWVWPQLRLQQVLQLPLQRVCFWVKATLTSKSWEFP